MSLTRTVPRACTGHCKFVPRPGLRGQLKNISLDFAADRHSHLRHLRVVLKAKAILLLAHGLIEGAETGGVVLRGACSFLVHAVFEGSSAGTPRCVAKTGRGAARGLQSRSPILALLKRPRAICP